MKRYCKIHIDMGKNQAFLANPMWALSQVLISISGRVWKQKLTCFRILDANGSYCGKFEIVDKP